MKRGFTSSLASRALIRSMAAIATGDFIRPAPDPLAGIDIEREYELIRQKRSTLSRSKRDMVVARWERIHNRKEESA